LSELILKTVTLLYCISRGRPALAYTYFHFSSPVMLNASRLCILCKRFLGQLSCITVTKRCLPEVIVGVHVNRILALSPAKSKKYAECGAPLSYRGQIACTDQI
jgi:hypothetical protein